MSWKVEKKTSFFFSFGLRRCVPGSIFGCALAAFLYFTRKNIKREREREKEEESWANGSFLIKGDEYKTRKDKRSLLLAGFLGNDSVIRRGISAFRPE